MNQALIIPVRHVIRK